MNPRTPRRGERIARTTLAFVALATLLCVPACLAPPGVGLFATKVRGPIAVGATEPPASGLKEGRAESHLAFGLFAYGDAGIEAAKRQGGITRIHHVDYEYKNVLGLFAVWTTIVYGE